MAWLPGECCFRGALLARGLRIPFGGIFSNKPTVNNLKTVNNVFCHFGGTVEEGSEVVD